MSPIDKIRKNKKKLLTPLVALILLAMVFTTSFIFVEKPVQAANHTDFDKYKKITIASSFIDTSLKNFPILIYDSTGDLQDEVLSNASDICFFDESNSTQFNHEIEKYDSGTGHLWAWVNVTSISSSSDTVVYMYYNDSDGGYSIGQNPSSVWDSDFTWVSHMNDSTTSKVWDSSDNSDFDGSKASAGNPAVSTSGKIGDCQDFSSDTITTFTGTNGNFRTNDITLEAWFKTDASAAHGILSRSVDTQNEYHWIIGAGGSNAITYIHSDVSNVNKLYVRDDQSSYDVNAWYYNAITIDRGVNGEMYDNTTKAGLENEVHSADDHNYNTNEYIGVMRAPSTNYFQGMIDEIRVSASVRNWSWINASFHSGNQSTGFITLGSETSQSAADAASSFSILGLSYANTKITWNGTSGNTVWCNESGDGYETLEINMSVNTSDNVTEIRVYINDMNDTSAYINASNITCYASSDNTSFGVPTHDLGNGNGIYTDAGGNISLNTTTWNAGTMGTDPFPIDNTSGWLNTSIYIRFKMAIPSGLDSNIFYSSSATNWKVYIGHYT